MSSHVCRCMQEKIFNLILIFVDSIQSLLEQQPNPVDTWLLPLAHTGLLPMNNPLDAPQL